MNSLVEIGLSDGKGSTQYFPNHRISGPKATNTHSSPSSSSLVLPGHSNSACLLFWKMPPLLTALILVKESPTLKVRVSFHLSLVYENSIQRAQNWRFGSSFSIKARRSVTGSRVGNTEFGLSVSLAPLRFFYRPTIVSSRLHCYHLWNATHYSGRTSRHCHGTHTPSLFFPLWSLSKPLYHLDRCLDLSRRGFELVDD